MGWHGNPQPCNESSFVLFGGVRRVRGALFFSFICHDFLVVVLVIALCKDDVAFTSSSFVRVNQ